MSTPLIPRRPTPGNYGLLAKILVEAVATDDSVRSAVTAAARKAGQAGLSGNTVIDGLRMWGYAPVEAANGEIELHSCPFDQLTCRHYPEMVGELNLQLIQGVLEAAGEPPQRASLAPSDGRCCVVVHPSGVTGRRQ